MAWAHCCPTPVWGAPKPCCCGKGQRGSSCWHSPSFCRTATWVRSLLCLRTENSTRRKGKRKKKAARRQITFLVTVTACSWGQVGNVRLLSLPAADGVCEASCETFLCCRKARFHPSFWRGAWCDTEIVMVGYLKRSGLRWQSLGVSDRWEYCWLLWRILQPLVWDMRKDVTALESVLRNGIGIAQP